MLYLITYELSKDKDYTSLYDAIKEYGTWWHYIESAWIIKTDETVSEISRKLTRYLDEKDDSLLVIKIDPSLRQGWLPKKAWEWIKKASS